jgi:hypothetical protein
VSNARQVDLLLSGIFGLDGAPLSGGRVYCYNAGSSTPKNVYNDVGLTIASENPVILDENGKAIKYALGSYKLVIKDANDSTLYTYDNLTYGFNPESVTADYSGSIYLASMGGDSSSIQGSTTLTTPISSLTEGMRFVFQSPFDCEADATIAIDEADAVDLYIADGSTPVTEGYIVEGQFYEIVFDGSGFRVLSTTGAIGTDKIGTGVVAGSNMQTGAVDTAQLNDGAVTTDKLANGAVTTDKVANGAVDTTQIKDDAVTTAKIIDGAITTDKVANGAVTTDKIEDYAINSYKIEGGAITSYHISEGAVGYAALANKAAYRNLVQGISTSGNHSAEEGKIIFYSAISSGSATLNISDPNYYAGTPLFIAKIVNASSLTVNILNISSEIVATYTVTGLLVIAKTAGSSWTKLHG